MVDAARLRVILSRLRARRTELRTYAERESKAYTADPQAVYASRYLLVTSIEDALSAANHIIASEGHRAPADYADAFRSLREAGILEPELTERLEAMARFRNLLIHRYAEIDDLRVHRFLQRDLDDLDRFIASVLDAFPELESR